MHIKTISVSSKVEASIVDQVHNRSLGSCNADMDEIYIL